MDDQYKTRQTLIQRLQDNQDEPSWEDFLRIYRPYIYAIIRNMNIPEHDLDDIVQQVMIKLWKYIQSYSFENRFRYWLSRVTKNCVKDYIQKRMKDAEQLEEVAKDERLAYLSAIALPDIDRIAEREWGIYLSNLALERISEYFSGRAIEVFRMSLKGIDDHEIAEKMELKINSVYRLKSRVKARMVQEIELIRDGLE